MESTFVIPQDGYVTKYGINLNLPPHEFHTERYDLVIVWEGPKLENTIRQLLRYHVSNNAANLEE